MALGNLNKKRLNDLIRQVLSHTSDEQVDDDDYQIAPGVSDPDDWPTLHVGAEGRSTYLDAVRECRKDPTIWDQVSERYVEDALDRLIIRVYGDRTTGAADDLARRLLKEIRESITEHTLYIPLSNLFLNFAEQLTLGEVTLIRSPCATSEILDRCETARIAIGMDDAARSERDEHDREVLDKACAPYPTCARTTVLAEAEMAPTAAENRVTEVLNVLRCFIPMFFRRGSYPHVGIAGVVSRSIKNSISLTGNGYTFRMTPVGAVYPFVLKDTSMAHLRRVGQYDRFHGMLRRSERTDLEQAVLAAAQWIGSGVDTEEPAKVILHHVIGLETLLLKGERDGIADKVALRVAHLRGGKDPLEHYTRAKKLYDLRCQVAHGGYTVFSPSDVAELESVALGCLLRVAHQTKAWQTRDQLVEWVNRRACAANEQDDIRLDENQSSDVSG